jgi:hypothetical protein
LQLKEYKMKTSILSKGAKRKSPQAIGGEHFLSHLFSQQVSVPVSITNSLVVFDFVKELEISDGLKKMSSKVQARLISVLAQALNTNSHDDIVKMLRDNGFSKESKQRLDALATELRNRLERKILWSGLPTVAIKDVLDEEFVVSSLSDYKTVTLPVLQDAIFLTQEVYGKFAKSVSVDDVATYISDILRSNSAFALARFLHGVFYKRGGASVQARLSYVVENLYSSIYGSNVISLRSQIPGLVYEIEDVDLFKDFSYADMLGGFFVGLRTIMGFSSSKSNMTVDITNLIQEMNIGIGDTLPHIPKVKGVKTDFDSDRVSREFTKWFIFRLVERVATQQYGSVESRIANIMDVRKYTRDETYDAVIREGLAVISVVFESFLDVTAMFKSLLMESTVYYADVHPLILEKYNQYLFKYLDKYKTFQGIASTHPRFLNESAIAINHNWQLSEHPTEFVLPDDAYSNKSMITNALDMSVIELFTSRKHSGSNPEIDADLAIDDRLLPLARSFTPMYHATIRGSDMFSDYAALKFGVAVMPYSKLKKMQVPFVRELLKLGRIESILNESEYASFFGVDAITAAKYFNPNEEMYFCFDSVSVVHFFWNADVMPYFEVTIPQPELFRLKPLVTDYPYVVARELFLVERKQDVAPSIMTISIDGHGRSSNRAKQIAEAKRILDILAEDMVELEGKDDASDVNGKEE